jgi:hypothetical protein
MKLVKLHICQLSAGSKGGSDPVPRRYRRIRGIAVHLAGAAAGKKDRTRLHRSDFPILIQQSRPAHAPARSQQIG